MNKIHLKNPTEATGKLGVILNSRSSYIWENMVYTVFNASSIQIQKVYFKKYTFPDLFVKGRIHTAVICNT
jgi:hypothetical protein